jgi:hypothetical protein
MLPKRVDHQIDELLLLVATQAGVLYVQRRTRRAARKVAIGAAVVTGVGAATATLAAGIGAVGITGGAIAWYRRRGNESAATTPPV